MVKIDDEDTNMVSGRDYDWDLEMSCVKPVTECVPVDSSHPLYILHTSGTTGTPKVCACACTAKGWQ